jgi:hypothetical protein
MDVGPESFVITDVSRWRRDALRTIEESRLQDKLRREIKAPSFREGAQSVGVSRFPRWHFCPICRQMRFITANEDEARGYPIPKCEVCKKASEMTPMGFVAVCNEGHLGDVDWHYWAHRGSRTSAGVCSKQGASLFFETTGQGGGDWSAISVRCGCGASKNFGGLVDVDSPAGMACSGRQPWKPARRDGARCNAKIRVFRRAASNLHFPVAVSAIDLATDHGSSVDTQSLANIWEGDPNILPIRTLYAAKQEDFDRAKSLFRHWIDSFADRNGCSAAAASDALRALLAGNVDSSETASIDASSADFQQQILREEWTALSGGREISGRLLQVRPVSIPADWPPELRRTIVGLSMVRRLREVRALLGFRRLSPSDESKLVPVDLGARDAGWYPGVEAWGEGIFLNLSEEAIRSWEAKAGQSLARRLRDLSPRVSRFGWDPGLATPRFLLLHSLAHAVVRRLGFDAGYSASSIRERIYSSSAGAGMSGMLIYTADGDSEGSLGGLVRMGNPGRFGKLLAAALQDISWCSADPVCKETAATGMDGLNAASCHACILVSETSCSYNNCLLDRRTLVELGGVEPFFKLEGLSEVVSAGSQP